LVLNAASGTVVSLSGQTYAPTRARTEALALQQLKANQRGKAYRLIDGEPKWFDLKALGDIMDALDLQRNNINTITSAVGASIITLGLVSVINPLEEIRACRNFVAHNPRRP